MRPLRSDSTPAADLIESVFEVATEDFVFRIRGGVRPSGAKASHQSGNPIGRLEGLIAVAFEVERGLDETLTAVLLGIHAARGSGDQGGSLIVFIEASGQNARPADSPDRRTR